MKSTSLASIALELIWFSSDFRERLVACFDVFLDDSGTHNESPFRVMGGFISDKEGCRALGESWREILDRYGIECFHMTDFENREKGFKHLSDFQRRSLLNELLATIRKNVRAGIAGAVPVVLYDKIIPPSLKGKIDDPLTIAFRLCLLLSHAWAKECSSVDDALAHMVESRQGVGRLSDAFHEWQRSGGRLRFKYKLESLNIFKKKVEALQAADLMAYESWKEMVNSQEKKFNVRYPLKTLIEGIPCRLYDADEKLLRGVLSDYQQRTVRARRCHKQR